MSKPISVGDWVVVVRASTVHPGPCYLGLVFKVSAVRTAMGGLTQKEWRCSRCGQSGFTTTVRTEAVAEGYTDEGIGIPIYRLKRLDPDALKDEVPTKEELTA